MPGAARPPEDATRAAAALRSTAASAMRGSVPSPSPRPPSPGRTKACARCRTPLPRSEFPLWQHADAVVGNWPIRHWCIECLVERGHLTKAKAKAYRAETRREEARKARALAEEQARTQRRTNLLEWLLEESGGNPDFDWAMTEAVRRRRAIRRANAA